MNLLRNVYRFLSKVPGMRKLLAPIRKVLRKKVPLGRTEIIGMRISILESMLLGIDERLQKVEKEKNYNHSN